MTKKEQYITHIKIDSKNSLYYSRGEADIQARCEDVCDLVYDVEKRK